MSTRDPRGAQGTEGGESFLARWARRKAQVQRTPEPDVAAAAVTAVAPPDERSGVRADAAVAGKDVTSDSVNVPKSPGVVDAPGVVELPDIDQLDQDSDYSAFLAPGADAGLRRRALRKLFSSPKFNEFDGLDTYRDDFTQFPALANVITADMKFEAERLARKLLADSEGNPAAAALVPPSTAVAANEAQQLAEVDPLPVEDDPEPKSIGPLS
jgi:Protein of unknown function (DUF3306)